MTGVGVFFDLPLKEFTYRGPEKKTKISNHSSAKLEKNKTSRKFTTRWVIKIIMIVIIIMETCENSI